MVTPISFNFNKFPFFSTCILDLSLVLSQLHILLLILNLKMTLGRSKFHSFLTLTFIAKSVSKNLLIRIVKYQIHVQNNIAREGGGGGGSTETPAGFFDNYFFTDQVEIH